MIEKDSRAELCRPSILLSGSYAAQINSFHLIESFNKSGASQHDLGGFGRNIHCRGRSFLARLGIHAARKEHITRFNLVVEGRELQNSILNEYKESK